MAASSLQSKVSRDRSGLQASEKRYRRLFEAARDGILILDADTGKVVDVNPFLMELLGYSFEEFIGKQLWDLGAFHDVAASKEAFRTLQDNKYIRYEDLPLKAHDGHLISVEFVSNVYLVDEANVIQCNVRDITERKKSDGERRQLLAAIGQAGEGIVMTDARGIIQFVNPAFERATGYSRHEAIGQNLSMLQNGEQDEAQYRSFWKAISDGKSWGGRMVNKRKDGGLYTEEMTISPVRDGAGEIVNCVAVKRDITEQLKVADQLQQIRKMESVGLLAGGVAHDFNNMLCVIVGYAEIALKKKGVSDSMRGDLQEILKAANRSADITRQLLTFARKQTIMPVAMDLNQSVEGMLKMLRQLIGEDIELTWHPKAGLCAIKMDPVQVDQILANLCGNARDAIAGVGKIAIETGNAVFDAAYCAEHAGFIPGEYALLSVSDDGCGMDAKLQDQMFEPFFTSKGVGEGTGLGLSMVYGIVEQNFGFINVSSKPEKGTTIAIYIPRYAGAIAETPSDAVADVPPSQGETVLVVEDELALLKMVKEILEEEGYRVLTASMPADAIEIAEKHASEIQLLITDVVMPKMNGRELAERLSQVCPEMEILFMSGYSTDVIVQRGVLDKTKNFIQKPFTAMSLAAKVRKALKNEK